MKFAWLLPFLALAPLSAQQAPLLTGPQAFGDWTSDSPGVRRKITAADLPPPGATKSAGNGAHMVDRPADAWPKAPAGFKVGQFATGLKNPRVIVTAPNGDLFVAESDANRVRVLRDADNDGQPELSEIFADGLKQPFGIAFYPPGPNPKYIYVANTDSVVRFPYKNGQVKADSAPEELVEVSGGGHLTGGGHWTRDLAFSKDGKQLFISIGSLSNNNDGPEENQRARIYVCDPDGKNLRTYASGIRNAVGLAIHPETGDLWMSVNERDGLGDDLVPDYISTVKDGGFYGWPWLYIGKNEDPKYPNKHPELKDKVIVPDVLLQAHSASLDLSYYDAQQFPAEYRRNFFASEHGSWNRARRTGYKVIRVPTVDGKATGEYIDFLTGFVTPTGDVWGRPVSNTTSQDGSLLVTDDGGNCIWRVTYTGK